MMTVGIETSGKLGSVALVNEGQLIGERELSRSGRRHARTLVAEIQALLEEADVARKCVEAIAVSLGPGSFTGLRVGITCAKSWAYAAGIDLIGVPTFDAIATQSARSAASLDVISDAQRGELFIGRYSAFTAPEREPLQEITIEPADEWIRSLSPDRLVTGPAVSRLAEQLSGVCEVEEDHRQEPRAASVARVGERSLLAGRTDDVWSLEPLYLRRSAAEEKADAIV